MKSGKAEFLKYISNTTMIMLCVIICLSCGKGGGLSDPAWDYDGSLTATALPLETAGTGDSPGSCATPLFDRNTVTAASSAAFIFTASFAESTSLEGIRLFGITGRTINVYRSGKESPLLTINGTAGAGWNYYYFPKAVKNEPLQISITALEGGATGDITEIEFLCGGRALSEVAEILTLVKNGSRASGISGTGSGNPAIHFTAASPQEATFTSGSVEGTPFSLTIDRDPGTISRAYLRYGSTCRLGVSLDIRVNGGPWRGTYAFEENGTGSSSYSHIEEIDPRLLVRGENIIRIRTILPSVTVSSPVLVTIDDNGWASPSACSRQEICDMSPSTDTAMKPGDYADLTFGGVMQFREAMVYITGGTGLTLRFLNVNGNDARTVGSVSVNVEKPGWHRVQLDAGEPGEVLRMTVDGESGAGGCTIGEVLVSGGRTGIMREARVAVSYPLNGEYFGTKAFIAGFADLPPAVESLNAGGTSLSLSEGGHFSAVISRETGYATGRSDNSWACLLDACNTTAEAQVNVQLYNDLTASSSSTGTGTSTNGGSSASGTNGATGTLSATVYPDRSKTIEFGNISIRIPAGAVDQVTEFSVVPLTSSEIAALNPGMTNVTSPAAGYRFLPSGKFRKSIEIDFQYGRALLQSGQVDQDVFMYYYDASLKTWKQMERVGVIPAKTTVVSRTDHFTDIINATMTVPEHPDPLNYNPNVIRDIRTASPDSGIKEIEPPTASPFGNANMSFPIEIPAGRKDMQPSVSLDYTSSTSNGPVGLGWSMPADCISIKTSNGVPHLTGGISGNYVNNVTYELNGSTLEPVPGTTGQYRERVEGSFRRIIRTGSGPTDYTWTVTDKDGVIYRYGMTQSSRLLNYRNGNTFTWNLERITDRFGNCINYYYVKTSGTTDDPWSQIYLDRITYTGRNGSDGPYSINFAYATGRSDIISSCRGGFKMYTDRLLSSITVSYNSQTVRRYVLEYTGGAFGKSLLAKITCQGTDLSDFYTHTFEYYDDVPDGRIFESTDTVFTGGHEAELMAFEKTSIDGRDINTLNAGLTAGFAILSTRLSWSVAGRGGISKSWSTTKQVLIDIDGDNRPDQVYLTDDGIYYRKNNGLSFESPARIPTLSALGKDSTMVISAAFLPYISPVSGCFSKAWSNSTTESYFEDVNGDGLIDFINNGSILYNHMDSGSPVFSDTPPVYGAISFEATGVATPSTGSGSAFTKAEVLKNFYRDDPLLMWQAPFRGMISIEAPVSMLDVKPESDIEYTRDDGLEVSIVKLNRTDSSTTGTVLWEDTVNREDYAALTPSGLNDIMVEEGDEIYFRVNSVDNGAYDVVSWDPLITYTGGDDSTDQNNRSLYSYRFSEDFSTAGGSSSYATPASGIAAIQGYITKKGATSDYITAQVVLVTMDEEDESISVEEILFEHEFQPSDVETLYLQTESSLSTIDLEKGQRVICRLLADTPVDWTMVAWNPLISYTSITVTDDEGVETQVNAGDDDTLHRENLVVERSLYAGHDSFPDSSWTAPQSGTINCEFQADLLNPVDNSDSQISGVMTLSVKRNGILVEKKKLAVKKDSGGLPGIYENGDLTALPLTSTSFEAEVTVEAGDRLYFTVTMDDPDVQNYINIGSPRVTYAGGTSVNVMPYMCWKDRSTPLSGGYRSWYYGRWNGENDTLLPGTIAPPTQENINNAQNAIDAYSSAMSSTTATDAEKEQARRNMETAIEVNLQTPVRNFSPMTSIFFLSDTESKDPDVVTPDYPAGIRDTELWQGHDSDCWIGPGLMGSSRVLVKTLPPYSETETDETEYTDIAGTTTASGRSTPKKSSGSSWSASVGLSAGISATYTYTNASCSTSTDYFDFNGDGFPDIVTSDGVYITNTDGSMGALIPATSGAVRATSSTNHDASLDLSGKPFQGKETKTSGSGKPEYMSQQYMGASIGVGAGGGDTTTDVIYLDMNGDGLPDRIAINGNGHLIVALNMGYSLGNAEDWGPLDDICHEKQSLVSIGGGAEIAASVILNQISYDKGKFSFGLGYTQSNSATTHDFIDLNGDSMPERVTMDVDASVLYPIEINPDGDINAAYNTGTEFDDAGSVGSGLSGSTISYARTRCFSVNGSASGTIPIWIPTPIPVWIGSFIINVGGAYERNGSAVRSTMVDINGDGLADHIAASGSDIRVRLNRTGRTNLLKTVRRPLGGTINLDYERRGNTTDMPQNRWVMKTVTMNDGFPDTADNTDRHSYTTAFTYDNGRYDRGEREFYGFATVTETRADESSIRRTYDNSTYYTKGIETAMEICGPDGEVYSTESREISLLELVTGRSMFPSITSETRDYYEGGDESLRQVKNYTYDVYGNITASNETAPSSPGGGIRSAITYDYRTDAYIMNNPMSIQVSGLDGHVYRIREGVYDSKGNLWKIRKLTDGSTYAETELYWNDDGNLYLIRGPENELGQRYCLTYGYDGYTGTHITSIADSYGYTSMAVYDPRFGAPLQTTDINGNSFTYHYDRYGRITAIFGPNDTGGDPGWEFRYHTNEFPARAMSYNRGRTGDAPVITGLCLDGMGREIQRARSADINGTYGFILSGHVTFDPMGRICREGQPSSQSADYSGYTAIPGINPVVTTYDPMGRIILVVYPDGTSDTTDYGIDTASTAMSQHTVDRGGNEVRTMRDLRGNTRSVNLYHNGEWLTTRYVYNPMNEIETIVDAAGNRTVMTYDNSGRRTAISNPDSGLVRFFYDPAGNMIRKVTANLNAVERSIHYIYRYTRLEGIDYPYSDDVTYTWGEAGATGNRAGRIANVACGNLKEERYYGRLGETVKVKRTITHDVPSGSVSTYTTAYQYDNMGRMRRLEYPDGEILEYTYDRGGLLRRASSLSNGVRCTYVNSMLYDEFGQYTSIEYGNGSTSRYTYNPLTRRLTGLATTGPGGQVYQNISYTYDNGGNILTRENSNFVTSDSTARTSTQEYEYDDLDRLTGSTGTYDYETWLGVFDKRINSYSSRYSYDSTGNITHQEQANSGILGSGETILIAATSYTWDYTYGTDHPHAPSVAGPRGYTYDKNGNTTRMTDSDSSMVRNIAWNEENRVTSTVDTTGSTSYRTDYVYDDRGSRIIKKGRYGEVLYVNGNYTVRNNDLISKHVYAGNMRIATRLINRQERNGTYTDVEKGIYYYHGDHIGSSSVTTGSDGAFHEHIEYFPYGETWVQDKASGSEDMPYRFTAREQDTETGLYYCGARYYDPRLGNWITADPMFANGRYFPQPNDHDPAHDYYWYLENDSTGELPGGGVFNTFNINLYQYGGLNPVTFVNPGETDQPATGNRVADANNPSNPPQASVDGSDSDSATPMLMHELSPADAAESGDFIDAPDRKKKEKGNEKEKGKKSPEQAFKDMKEPEPERKSERKGEVKKPGKPTEKKESVKIRSKPGAPARPTPPPARVAAGAGIQKPAPKVDPVIVRKFQQYRASQRGSQRNR